MSVRRKGSCKDRLGKIKEKTGVKLTDGHEGFGVETRLRHADAVNSKHPHFIQNSFNHPLSFVCR